MIALLCLLVIWNGYLTIELNHYKKEDPTKIQSNITVLKGVLTDITELVSKSEPKVVSIVSKKHDEHINSGSGAIYKSDANGVYIITNNHVISGSDSIGVSFANGETLDGVVVGFDEVTDIAVILTKPEFSVEKFLIGDSATVKKGEYVIAIGSPLGSDFQGTVSFGIVSGINRSIGIDQNKDGSIDWHINAIQTDAAINPGNSGGPLVNLNGELIGINTMKALNSDRIGFAIGSNEVIPVVDKLISNGKIERPYIGIKTEDISLLTTYQKSFFSIPLDITEGVFIKDISTDSNAYLANLRAGDIIVKINDVVIKNEKDYSKVIYSFNLGETITITYKRNADEFNANVVLE